MLGELGELEEGHQRPDEVGVTRRPRGHQYERAATSNTQRPRRALGQRRKALSSDITLPSRAEHAGDLVLLRPGDVRAIGVEDACSGNDRPDCCRWAAIRGEGGERARDAVWREGGE